MATVFFEGTAYTVAENESVLSALLRGGANIGFSCGKGSCQTCLLQCLEGEPGAEAFRGLRPEAIEAGMFLPCICHPQRDLEVIRPDTSVLFVGARLADKSELSSAIFQLSFELETHLDWRPGQFVNLRRADGTTRSYSISSIYEEDYHLSIQVKRIDNGEMSNWLIDEFQVGDWIQIQGPIGHCYYEPDDPARNILMLGTGSGLSPLMAIARDALRQGHRGDIVLVHGSSYADGLYLRDELAALAAEHPNFTYRACLTHRAAEAGVERGRVVDLAFASTPDLEGWMLYLCGLPAMVHEARRRAILCGVRRDDMRADPFEYAHPFEPDDAAKIAAIEPEPELWAALEDGDGLREILTEFYDTAYRDPRLAPFFSRITKDRAIGQQYSFLSDLMTGAKRYFGLRPFNAHHWMVISDELFDYRERIIESFMRKWGLPEPMVRRWSALHETFRREIVKSTARGLIVDGVEHPIAPPEEVTAEIATVCDGCEGEIDVGDRVRYHGQTGQMFCHSCGATAPP